MFAGEFRAHATVAGRFQLPPIFLTPFPATEEGGRHVVILKSLDRSLWLYPAQGWEAKLDAARQQLDDQQSRLLMHYVVAESTVAAIDAQGRLAIPKPMRQYAAITTEVVLLGLYERIEVWSPTRWEEYVQDLEARHEGELGKILDLL